MNIKILIIILLTIFSSSCSSSSYEATVEHVDLNRFMKKWYVIAGRFTFLEKGAHNAIEKYEYNTQKKRIDISFSFNKDGFEGPLKDIPQKGWIENTQTNAYWTVSPFWPLKFDYLVIALEENYSWTAIGVPSGKYLWIMSDRWNWTDEEINQVLEKLSKIGYPVNDIVRIPQKW